MIPKKEKYIGTNEKMLSLTKIRHHIEFIFFISLTTQNFRHTYNIKKKVKKYSFDIIVKIMVFE
jgi:hypothetical protein